MVFIVWFAIWRFFFCDQISLFVFSFALPALGGLFALCKWTEVIIACCPIPSNTTSCSSGLKLTHAKEHATEMLCFYVTKVYTFFVMPLSKGKVSLFQQQTWLDYFKLTSLIIFQQVRWERSIVQSLWWERECDVNFVSFLLFWC